MSIHDSRGAGSFLKLEDGEVVTVLLDVAKWGKRILQDGKNRFLVAVFVKIPQVPNGFVWAERTLGLSGGAFDALCLVCPTSGKVAVEVTRFGEGLDTFYTFKRIKAEASCEGLPVESDNKREPRAAEGTMAGARTPKLSNDSEAAAAAAAKFGL